MAVCDTSCLSRGRGPWRLLRSLQHQQVEICRQQSLHSSQLTNNDLKPPRVSIITLDYSHMCLLATASPHLKHVVWTLAASQWCAFASDSIYTRCSSFFRICCKDQHIRTSHMIPDSFAVEIYDVVKCDLPCRSPTSMNRQAPIMIASTLSA